MAENKAPFLCGGVFFFLLVQATLADGTASDHRNGIGDQHSDPIVMRDLIYVFTGSENYGAKKDTSKYRECDSEGSVNLPFNNIAVIATFDNAVKNKFSDTLDRMSEFVDWHINPEMREWFVKALLEIIECDSEIKDQDIFYINSDGSTATKSEVKTRTEFEFQPFLLGVLHYILTNRREKNSYGKATLNALGTKKERKERRYTGNAGSVINRMISVVNYVPAKTAEPVVEKVPVVVEKTDDEVIAESLGKALGIFADALTAQKHQMAEQIRANREKRSTTDNTAEVEDDSSSGAAEEKPETVQQMVVNQYGDHPVNIGYVQNLKL